MLWLQHRQPLIVKLIIVRNSLFHPLSEEKFSKDLIVRLMEALSYIVGSTVPTPRNPIS